MESGTYVQINYNPDDLDDVSIAEVDEKEPVVTDEQLKETGQVLEEAMSDRMVEEAVKDKECDQAATIETETSWNDEESEVNPDGAEVTPEEPAQSGSEETPDYGETIEEPAQEEIVVMVPAEIQDVLKHHLESCEDIQRTLRRLENKFADEILSGENRDSAVKTMYKELNEYKAGIVERALKNVLYDIVDIRETMLSQIRYLREKDGVDSISLNDLESYADDIGDILEKHDVTIYKGKSGEENVAVRQKIVRKVETENDELVKKVAESLSYGYEFGSKIIYPEKISVYVKRK